MFSELQLVTTNWEYSRVLFFFSEDSSILTNTLLFKSDIIVHLGGSLQDPFVRAVPLTLKTTSIMSLIASQIILDILQFVVSVCSFIKSLFWC